LRVKPPQAVKRILSDCDSCPHARLDDCFARLRPITCENASAEDPPSQMTLAVACVTSSTMGRKEHANKTSDAWNSNQTTEGYETNEAAMHIMIDRNILGSHLCQALGLITSRSSCLGKRLAVRPSGRGSTLFDGIGHCTCE